MTDMLIDIEVLENAVIALQEGASDEKRMAIYSLCKMIEQKKTAIENFEKEVA